MNDGHSAQRRAGGWGLLIHAARERGQTLGVKTVIGCFMYFLSLGCVRLKKGRFLQIQILATHVGQRLSYLIYF